MTCSLLSRLAGRFLLPAASGLLFIAAGRSQSPAPLADAAESPLPEYVVSATRSPQDPAVTPSAVTLVSLPALDRVQITDLRTALAREPGVGIVTTGAIGGPSSVFLRGANSHQTLFVVDGVRMNDRSASYTTTLGAADLLGLDRLEVLRGPQSTLYGSSAMGGVILLDTAYGGGTLRGGLSGLAGSHDTWGGSATAEGAAGPLNYSAAIGRFETDNDRPQNRFEQSSAAGRLEFVEAGVWRLGATVRWLDGDYEEPGSRLFPSPGRVDHTNTLVTAYAQAEAGETFSSRLTLARHERDYAFADTWGRSELGNVRRIADWQNIWQATEALELVGGVNYERSRYLVGGGTSKDEVAAGYVSATLQLEPEVTLTGGLRYDHFDSVGDATTGRLGAAWRVQPGTKLRATFGTGFSAPGSDDRFGVPAWGQRPNPDLRPEKSRGWDVGIDQVLWQDRVTVAATYFQNRFRDLFEWETVDFTTFEGRTVNRARASTEGVELGLSIQPTEPLQVRLSYTYLEAENEETGEALIRRPRHTLDGDVTYAFGDAWTAGVGARVLADRSDVGGPMDDFSTVRLFASHLLRPGLTLKARVENVLDEDYEEVLGYPAPSRAVFGSIEWTF